MTDFFDQEWVYIGRCDLKDKSEGVEFLTVGNEEDYHVFKPSASTKRYTVGGVYRISTNLKQAKFGAHHESFLRMYDDETKIAKWKLADEARDVVKRAKKLHSEAMKESKNTIFQMLEPIRDMYGRTDNIGRRAIEALVLSYIRNSPV